MARRQPVTEAQLSRGTSPAAAALREAAFVKLYVGGPPHIRYNGIQTVLALGWTRNVRSASVTATRMLQRASVKQALARYSQAAFTSAEKVIKATALRAYATVQDVMTYDADGTVALIPSTELSEAGAAIVGGVKQRRRIETDRDGHSTETIELEVKLKDGDEARRDLLKFHGLLKESVHVQGEILHVHLSAAAEDFRTRLLGGSRVVSPQRGAALPAAPTNGAGPDSRGAVNGGPGGAAL